MGPVEEQVLLLLKQGDRRYTEIVAETGHAHKVVWDALTRLRKEKLVGLKKRGVYRISEKGAALLDGSPYALYRLRVEARVAGTCFDTHVGYARRGGALYAPTPYAVDSFGISALIDALQTLFRSVAGSLRLDLIDLPRAWSCDIGPVSTMEQYFAHLEGHLANFRRLTTALRGQGDELERAAEVSEELIGKAEAVLARLKDGWQKGAFDSIMVS